jgi:hypothetical protein
MIGVATVLQWFKNAVRRSAAAAPGGSAGSE